MGVAARAAVMLIASNLKGLALQFEHPHDHTDLLSRETSIRIEAVFVALRKVDHPPSRIVVISVRLELPLAQIAGAQLPPELIVAAILDGLTVGFAGFNVRFIGQKFAFDFEKDTDFHLNIRLGSVK